MRIIKWLALLLIFQGGFTYANIEKFKLKDETHLRTGWWDSKTSPAQGTIVLLIGRASFIEKNQQLIDDLTSRGFNVETFDWRGQGGSTRLLLNSQKCHIDSFDTYLNDMHEYLIHYVRPRRPGPWLLMGISMGGHLALRYANDHPQSFKKVALVVPMFEMITKPFPRPMVGPLVKSLSLLGFSGFYAFGYTDINLKGPMPPFSNETSDQEQHKKTQALMRQYPELVVSGPTFGWVAAAVDSIEATKRKHFGENLPPMELYLAGQDTLVENKVSEQRCRTFKNCSVKMYENSRHNLPKERPEIRELFLEDVINFLRLP